MWICHIFSCICNVFILKLEHIWRKYSRCLLLTYIFIRIGKKTLNFVLHLCCLWFIGFGVVLCSGRACRDKTAGDVKGKRQSSSSDKELVLISGSVDVITVVILFPAYPNFFQHSKHSLVTSPKLPHLFFIYFPSLHHITYWLPHKIHSLSNPFSKRFLNR